MDALSELPMPDHIGYTPNGYECTWAGLPDFQEVVGVYYLYDGDASAYKFARYPGGNRSSTMSTEESIQLEKEETQFCNELLHEISKQTDIKCKLSRNSKLLIQLDNDPFSTSATNFVIELYIDDMFSGYFIKNKSKAGRYPGFPERTGIFTEDIEEATVYTSSRSAKSVWNHMNNYSQIVVQTGSTIITYDDSYKYEFRVAAL